MPTTDLVSCMLWVSKLAPASDLSVVKELWQASRKRNPALGLTGAVIFDGERFCELLEGPMLEIEAAYREVEHDARQTELHVLHVSSSLMPRRTKLWRSGYCDAAALDAFVGKDGLWGESAVTAFLEMLPLCELST